MSKYLYHVTTKENAEKILKDGLIPSIGPNSKLVNETDKNIYLCSYKNVAYWRLLLNRPVILAIDRKIIDDLNATNNIDYRKYKGYDEYRINTSIPPEYIKKTYVSHKYDDQINKRLCMSYIQDISFFCKSCAEYYNNKYECYSDDEDSIYNDSNISDDMYYTLKATIFVLKNIDYSKLDPEEIREYLKDFGESGEYTFCDNYNHTEFKLYEMLIKYPIDILSELRTELYDYIIENLSCCLDMNTGGWCIY